MRGLEGEEMRGLEQELTFPFLETVFFFDVQATPRPCTSKQEKVPFLGRERCVFVFLCSKKIASGNSLRLL